MIKKNNKEKKSKKNLKFLFKIKRQANQMYNRKLVQQKNLRKYTKKLTYLILQIIIKKIV